MRDSVPEPEQKIQPIRLVEQKEAHRREAEAGGIEDLVEFRAFYTDELLLYGAIAGPEDGELVVLLHGFPDFWLSWSRQIPALVKAGYRVVVPDQRGYNFSEKPASIEAYTLDHLGGDIADVVELLDADRAHLVGHDWGGAVSWWLAQNRPDLWETVSILNCPHHEVMFEQLKLKNLRQIMRSWYIGVFQLPWIPEMLAGARDSALLVKALQEMSYGDSFSDREFQVYRKAWGREGALKAMINWYRAARRTAFSDETTSSTPIDLPLQIIWGERDAALDKSLVEPSAAQCVDAQIHWVPHAAHWVQRDDAQVVNEKLLEFMGTS